MKKTIKSLLSLALVLVGTVATGSVASAQKMNIKDFNQPAVQEAIHNVTKYVPGYYDENDNWVDGHSVSVVDDKGDFETDEISSLSVEGSVSDLSEVGVFAKLCYLYVYKFSGKEVKLDNAQLDRVYLVTSANEILAVLPNVESISLAGKNLNKVNIEADKLNSLSLDAKKLSTFKCSNPKQMKTLSLSNLPTNKIDVSNYPNLTSLSVSKTPSVKNISKLTKLTSIYCYKTKMKKLNLTKSGKLTGVGVTYSNLETINMPKDVKYVSLSGNNLKSLSVSKCKKLSYLRVDNNKNLRSLDVSKNTYLSEITVYGTKIKKLNLQSKNVYLEFKAKKNQKINVTNYIGNGWTVTDIYGDIKYDKGKGVAKVTKKKSSGHIYFKKGSKKRVIYIYVR